MLQNAHLARSAALLALLCPALRAQGPPEGFQEVVVWSGLASPTAVRFAPDGRVFVAEKSGRIRVFDDTSDASPTLFADLRPQVYDVWDRGLLGLAIHPDWPTQPYVYVLYAYDYLGIESSCTDYTGNGCMARGRVSRLTADVNAGPVMTGPELVFIEDWCQQFPSHSTGDLDFGFDGALYVTAGDGASFNYVDYGQTGNPCADPPNEGGALRSQDIRTSADALSFDGTVLRIDPLTGAAMPDNPLFGGAISADDRIIAYGLRNPFRATVRPGTLELWSGDVGWGTWEEINVVRDPLDALIENFGWPCYEGTPRQSGYDGTNLPLCESLYGQGTGAVTPPYHAYVHQGSASITGLAFVEGSNYPAEYDGALFFADYSARWIRVMYADAAGEPDPTDIDTFRSGVRPVDLQFGPDGNLYYVDLGSNRVLRFEHFRANQPPTALAQADVTNGSAPLAVQFDGSASFDPDQGDTLDYAWDLDGDGAFDDSTLVAPQAVYGETGSVAVGLRVSDGEGAFDVDTLVVSVDNAPPVVTIHAPTAGDTWRVGDLIVFSGSGDDPDSGTLPDEALDWEIVLMHCDHEQPDDCHEHSVTEVHGESGGQFVAPDHEYPSFLEFRLTGTDSGPADWWDAGWSLRQRLTIDNSASSTNLLDFPLLVRLDPTRFDATRVASDGSDLRFVSADGTQALAHQIETWDLAGTSLVWVRVPLLAAGSGSGSIWMYYDSPAAAPAQAPQDVWSAGYAGVWHLDAGLQDSTANANHAANQGTAPVAGYLGAARSFDGTNDWLDCGSHASLAITGGLTISAWARVANSGLNSAMRVLSKKQEWNSPHGYNLEHHPSGNTVTSLGSGSDYGRANGIDLGPATWHWLVATHQNGTARIYVDGVDRTSDSSASPLIASAQALHIGRRSGGGDYYLGDIDEVRISSVVRSADWIAAQHRSMTDGMITFGPPHELGFLVDSTSIQIQPETALVRFESIPSGVELVAFGESDTTPFEHEAIVNGSTTVSAPAEIQIAGRRLEFDSWSDGGARTHTLVIAPDQEPLVARYRMFRRKGAR